MTTRLSLDLHRTTFADLLTFVETLRRHHTPPDCRLELVQSVDEPVFRLQAPLQETFSVGPQYPSTPMAGPQTGLMPPMGPPVAPGERFIHHGPSRPGGLVIMGSTSDGSWARDLMPGTAERWIAAIREALAEPALADSTRGALTDLLEALSPPVPPPYEQLGYPPPAR